MIKFIDLFSGIGGFHFGLEKLGFECQFASDINSDCQKTYQLNFNQFVNGDIQTVHESKIPDHNVLCAGFPCQPFSICGKQKGFRDERGNLFFEITRIVEHKQPEVIFLENVRHLKYHDKGNTLKTIVDILENELKYKVSWDVLNAKDYGMAQNRERIIIIAHNDKKFDFSKITKKKPLSISSILDKDKKDFEYLAPEEYTLIENPKRQKSGLIFVGYRNKGIRKKGVRPNTEHQSRVHKQPNRIYCSSGTHPTIPSQETAGRFFILHNGKVRKLTIDECFRLMGFPKHFKRYSSNGKLYNQAGNAVCVPMITSIGEEIKNQFF